MLQISSSTSSLSLLIQMHSVCGSENRLLNKSFNKLIWVMEWKLVKSTSARMNARKVSGGIELEY